ncbi:hypothetical protein ACFWPV_10195 [Streptomyces uncialis]|uniref:hypothetical protein n=1 Tax=Streptomyces uncialis TaxID=1048205 RepID=UPI00365252F3
MTRIQFEAPSPRLPRPRPERIAFAGSLRNRPGQWALWGAHDSQRNAYREAHYIRHAPPGGAFGTGGVYDAECRTLCGEYRVYVRYLGTPSEVSR